MNQVPKEALDGAQEMLTKRQRDLDHIAKILDDVIRDVEQLEGEGRNYVIGTLQHLAGVARRGRTTD